MFNNIIMNIFFVHKNIIFNGKELDKYQSKAVSCNKKNYLVVAGAGSGKTLTITAKVDHLIHNNVDKNKILCISFTNETVNSLKERLNNNVDVKTFHKLALDIIGSKKKIVNDNLLTYIIDEFFLSIIYFDNTYILLKYIDSIDRIKSIILSFINQMKAKKLDSNFIYKLIHNSLINIDNRIILILIFKIYIIYEEELKSEDKIDFNDIINIAIDKIDTLKYFKYKYIIVDEYQDTSISKYLLLKKLQDKFNISIMAVGDDYQSIYSFTGCDLKLFTKFKKYFNNSKIIKLKYNYRNTSDILEISKRFVMKNKNQISKRLISTKYINNSINILYIDNEEDALIYLINLYDNILILGRNNKDIDNLIEKEIIIKKDDKYIYKLDETKNINYLTIHSSKGLEEDNIIILNAIDDVLGLPNKIEKDEVIKLLNDNNQMEEERRLFYVALTRAKKRVFILTKRNKESIFIKELIKDFKRRINIIYLDKKL